jgi:hypothetical protein
MTLASFVYLPDNFCRYENISYLIDAMERVFDTQGYTGSTYSITSLSNPARLCQILLGLQQRHHV